MVTKQAAVDCIFFNFKDFHFAQKGHSILEPIQNLLYNITLGRTIYFVTIDFVNKKPNTYLVKSKLHKIKVRIQTDFCFIFL